MGLFGEGGPKIFGRGQEQPSKRKEGPEQKLKPEGASSPEEIALHKRISQMSAEELNAEKQKVSEREKALFVWQQETIKQFPFGVSENISKAYIEKKLEIERIKESIGRREDQFTEEGTHDIEKGFMDRIKRI